MVLNQKRVDLEKILGKRFFTMRVVKHRNRLSSEVVDDPSLKLLQASLDGALSKMI